MKNNKDIVLASKSPRRHKLLFESGISVEIVEPKYDEEGSIGDDDPAAFCIRHAIAKARSVCDDFADALIIAADTIVVVNETILGKPEDTAQAEAMLTRIEGKSHYVYSGIAIIDSESGREEAAYQKTKVHIKPLTADEIGRYVAGGEPMDKAGAYAIQGQGAFIVDRIEGDYFNVVGLPMSLLGRMLVGFGYHVI